MPRHVLRAASPGFARLLGLILAGAAPFILAESAMRLIGYRAPEDPHLEGFSAERAVFMRKDGWLHVAPDSRGIWRTDPFPAAREPGTLRVFSTGDSVTWGHRGNEFHDPLKSYSEVLEELLRSRLPTGPHRVINCGARTFATGRVEKVVREIMDYAPDAVIVYAGTSQHIESILRGELQARQEGWKRQLWRMRVTGALAALMRPSKGISLSGLRARDEALRAPFLGPRTALRDPGGLDLLADGARRDLTAIADACRQRSVPLVLSTVPANLRFPPFATYFSSPKARAEGEAAMRRIGRLLRAGLDEEALAAALQSSEAHPEAAGLHFLLAQARERVGRLDEARASYRAARDSDAFPIRALGAVNDAVRRLAHDRPEVALADIERLFERAVPDGIPDDRLFLDNCHARPEAHRLIAEELYRALKSAGVLRRASPRAPEHRMGSTHAPG